MKARRRALTARAARTPTVRRIKPAITPVRPKSTSIPRRVEGPGTQAEAPSTAPGAYTDPLGGRPVALEVDLGRGLVLSNPVMVASGPFGYGVEVADLVDLARLGGLVTRGTTLRARTGHAGARIVETPAGVLLGIGLANPGLEVVLERYAPAWVSWTVPVIVNLGGETAADYAEAARRLDGVPGVAGIELNLSCAGAGRGARAFGLEASSASAVVAAVRRATDLPVIAKLTAAAGDVPAVARAVEDAGADAVAAINTLPALAVAPDRGAPLLGGVYGGLCGPAIRSVALRVVYEVAQAVDVPVIGIGGVAGLDDVLDLLAVGASAVGVGVAALADPMLPVRLADELADACRARGVGSVGELVGTALPARPGPASTHGAEYAR